jgi:hypothetical protein
MRCASKGSKRTKGVTPGHLKTYSCSAWLPKPTRFSSLRSRRDYPRFRGAPRKWLSPGKGADAQVVEPQTF